MMWMASGLRARRALSSWRAAAEVQKLGRGAHRISTELVQMTKIADMTGLIAGAQQCQYCGAPA